VSKPEAGTAGIIDAGIEAIRAAGGRVTTTKRLLLEVLATTPGHLSSDELASLVQGRNVEVAPSTIYRILDEFERLKLVEHSHSGTGPATYHLRSVAHGHLTCQRCGSMIEVSPRLFEDLVTGARQQHGFEVDPHHFAVLGVCAACIGLT